MSVQMLYRNAIFNKYLTRTPKHHLTSNHTVYMGVA